MLSLLSDGLSEYVHDHTQPPSRPELFAQLQEETLASLPNPQMQVGRVEGQFLRMMVQLSGAKRVLEIGTYSGYSALAMASGLPEGGTLLTCDIDPEATAVARRHFDRSPWGHAIEIRLAPALETLAALAKEGAQFDLAFIDADKESYVDYYESVLPMLPPGGLILADNTLWSGKVLDPQEESDHAIVRFNRHVCSDERVESALLSIRDGIMMLRRKG